MKKLAVALAVLIVAVVALPVSAAQMTLGGKLSSEVAYDLEGKESSTITDLTLELGVGFTGGQTIRGVVEMTPMGWSFENGSIVIDEDHSETYGLGIKTARGGNWHARTLIDMVERAAAPAAAMI